MPPHKTTEHYMILPLRPRVTLVLLCIIVASDTFAQPDSVFDPLPSAPPLFPVEDDERQPGTPVSPTAKPFQRELSGFGIGDPTHANAVYFANRTAAEITALSNSGLAIDRIVVIGYADGIPNDGVAFVPELLPPRCRTITSLSDINDSELAFLRGCVVAELLFSRVSRPFAGGVPLQTDRFDEPDGGASGPTHRRVVVEVYFSQRRRQ
jgi:hypothetical protein